MLDAHRKQAIGLELDRLAFDILGGQSDALGALDVGKDPRHRQAALLAGLGAFFFEDARIDDDHRRVLFLGNIQHQHLHVAIDLGRGEADARGVIHRLEHVFGEFFQGAVERGHRLRPGAQARIGEFEDVEQTHGAVPVVAGLSGGHAGKAWGNGRAVKSRRAQSLRVSPFAGDCRRRFSPAIASDRRPGDGTIGPRRRRGPVSCTGQGLRQGSGFQRTVVCAAESLLYTRQSRRGIR